jgi:hypothetical protein
MRDLFELGVKPYKRNEPAFRPPTDEEIAGFEKHFGVRLPDDYVWFIRTFNGGRAGAVDTFTTGNGYPCSVGRFFYLLPEDPSRLDKVHHPNGWEFGNLWAETRSIREAVGRNRALGGLEDVSGQLTEAIVPFASDTGNASCFVFDFREKSPPVCLAVASRGFSLVKLADSFGEFVDGLREVRGG